MSEVETLISSKDYEAIRKRAETAEAILADVLADVDGVDQPQLSIGRQVWWQEDVAPEYSWIVRSGRIVGVGRRMCSVYVVIDVVCQGDGKGTDIIFVPTGNLFFSEEAARKAE